MKKLRLSKETIVSLENATLSNAVGGFWSIPTHCPDDYPDCSINDWCQSANTCTAYRWCPSDNATLLTC
ncbi:MAG TPA: class I lanthipeptide [Thermoanaerobaculia bacterium]|nr:class I lanthipeptide [Thermoanaerobaculia bacterium]